MHTRGVIYEGLFGALVTVRKLICGSTAGCQISLTAKFALLELI